MRKSPQFKTPEQEIAYWKLQANRLQAQTGTVHSRAEKARTRGLIILGATLIEAAHAGEDLSGSAKSVVARFLARLDRDQDKDATQFIARNMREGREDLLFDPLGTQDAPGTTLDDQIDAEAD
jgi:hypothetical protein